MTIELIWEMVSTLRSAARIRCLICLSSTSWPACSEASGGDNSAPANPRRMRTPGLVPLSREHHYALVFCRTVLRGCARPADPEWVARWTENARRYYKLDLVAHFQAEDEVLFPLCRQIGLDSLADALCADHRALRDEFLALSSSGAAGVPAGASPDRPPIDRAIHVLQALAGHLEAHIRQEERTLFEAVDRLLATPEHEARVTPLQLAIEARLGRAECARHPELIGERPASESCLPADPAADPPSAPLTDPTPPFG